LFQAPLPPPRFAEPFIASRRDIKCVRPLGVGYEGTEDCLVANVFTPTLNDTSNLPVMVWIKGKEFDKVYEKELTFKNFVENEVIVVTLNFRESILGFLCLGTETAPGNAGLKDIIAGLEWIHENIANFGGNPNNVTLIGHGSGASAVDLITLSHRAEGLVHKAIAQSGTALAPWAVSRDNLHYAVQVAESLGHIITNIEDLSEIFTRASISTIMAAINDLNLYDNSLAFSPCLEKDNLTSVQPFMTKSPLQTIAEGDFLQIPFLTGFVDYEGTIRLERIFESDWLQKMEKDFSDFLQSDLQFESDKEKHEIAENIKKFYFDGESVNFDNILDYISYTGDTMILISAIREARMRSGISSSPIYLYQFSYKGELGQDFVGIFSVESAAHSEDLGYLFSDLPLSPAVPAVPDVDRAVSNMIIERWTNFAKLG
jgi:carboxylesterase type B